MDPTAQQAIPERLFADLKEAAAGLRDQLQAIETPTRDLYVGDMYEPVSHFGRQCAEALFRTAGPQFETCVFTPGSREERVRDAAFATMALLTVSRLGTLASGNAPYEGLADKVMLSAHHNLLRKCEAISNA